MTKKTKKNTDEEKKKFDIVMVNGAKIEQIWERGRGRSSDHSGNQSQPKFHEIPPLIITHNEIRDVDGTFFVTFNGLLQCTMDFSDHVLHAHSDRDAMTDSGLAATPSFNDWSVLGATTPMKEQGHVEHIGTSGV